MSLSITSVDPSPPRHIALTCFYIFFIVFLLILYDEENFLPFQLLFGLSAAVVCLVNTIECKHHPAFNISVYPQGNLYKDRHMDENFIPQILPFVVSNITIFSQTLYIRTMLKTFDYFSS